LTGKPRKNSAVPNMTCGVPTVSALGVVGEAPVRDSHIPNWYGAVGVNIGITIFNGFLFNARAKASKKPRQISPTRIAKCQYRLTQIVLAYTISSPKLGPLLVVVNRSKNPQPLIRQWFPVNSLVLLQDIHIRLT